MRSEVVRARRWFRPCSAMWSTTHCTHLRIATSTQCTIGGFFSVVALLATPFPCGGVMQGESASTGQGEGSARAADSFTPHKAWRAQLFSMPYHSS